MPKYGYVGDIDDIDIGYRKFREPKASYSTRDVIISPKLKSLYDEISAERRKQKGKNAFLLDKCLSVLEAISIPNMSCVWTLKEEIQDNQSCFETYCPSFFKSHFSKLIDRTLAIEPPKSCEVIKSDSGGFIGKYYG